MKKTLFYLILLYGISFPASAQKKALSHDDYDLWQSINESNISRDGNWISYYLSPVGEGDPTLLIKDSNGNELLRQKRGSCPKITFGSKYVVFKITPAIEEVKELKRVKTKKDDLPKDTLAIYSLSNMELVKIPRVKSYKIPEKWAGWIAYQPEPEKSEKKENGEKENEKENEKEKSKKAKKENKDNGFKLIVRNLTTAKQDTFRYVTDYIFAKEGKKLAFISTGNDSTFQSGVYVYDFELETLIPAFRSKGKYSQIAWDVKGSQMAFIADLDTTKVQIRPFGIYYWNTTLDSAKILARQGNASIPESWVISENYRPYFSKDGSKLYFGTAPEPIVQDTTLLPEEIVNVEVWSYTDGRLHTQQKVEKEADLKKSYLAVVHTPDLSIVQLGSELIETVKPGNEGNAGIALGTDRTPYQQLISWEGRPYYSDLYMVDLNSGRSENFATKIRGNASLSPAAKYVYWYNYVDSAWFSYAVESKKIYQITDNNTVPFFYELNDIPSYPRPYGVASWTENDEKILIYDRYDIWEIDPENKTTPVNLTRNGRTEKTTYRYIKLDNEERFLKKNQKLVLRGFNETDKSESIFSFSMSNHTLKELIKGDYRFRNIKKAQDADRIIFTKENFRFFPDIIVTDMGFRKETVISHANPQQNNYFWGSAEPYSWTSLDGIPLEGILIKPEGFDPKKQYPMMVYFYERSSNGLNRHIIPAAGRSTINFSLYASRGYLIFIPDIVYRIGYPGESAFNCVIPGVTSLIDQGFVDPNHIGVQGHSWGGYQIAYLVTKTNIFKCAESGAPVSNMTSAYGGIRWGTGLSRMFQYEHSQSRIGGTLWEYPIRYIENSPIFFVDKIHTPLLILHNDADTAVPWYQGIEFFVALRRLGKEAWLVNYQGEPHGIVKAQNKKDFAIRMQQYFDYYLKDAPMPVWMKRGVPATEVGIRQGYEPVSTENN